MEFRSNSFMTLLVVNMFQGQMISWTVDTSSLIFKFELGKTDLIKTNNQ